MEELSILDLVPPIQRKQIFMYVELGFWLCYILTGCYVSVSITIKHQHFQKK